MFEREAERKSLNTIAGPASGDRLHVNASVPVDQPTELWRSGNPSGNRIETFSPSDLPAEEDSQLSVWRATIENVPPRRPSSSFPSTSSKPLSSVPRAYPRRTRS
jgi:hypothetical protein